MQKKKIRTLVILLILASAVPIFHLLTRPTKIAFVNFREPQMAELELSKNNSFIRIKRFDPKEDDFSRLPGYHAIYLFHVSYLSEEQRAHLKAAKEKGAKVYSHFATSKENEISNLNPEEKKAVQSYLKHPTRENLFHFLNYNRRAFHGRSLFSREIKPAQEVPDDFFYHYTSDKYFTRFEAYETYLAGLKKPVPGQKKVVLISAGAGSQPQSSGLLSDITKSLESKNITVIPLAGFQKRFDNLKKARPDMIIYLPHGRLTKGSGEELITWLKKRNIPLLTPQLIYSSVEEWTNSQTGMSGGMMGQNIVVPELDGGTLPYVIGAQFPGPHGYHIHKAIPERLETFSQMVSNWLELKDIPNRDRRITLFYYKGAGQNALVAGGLEVTASVLHLLEYLKTQGYTVGELPASPEELLEKLNREGPLLGNYAEGSLEKFVESGNPALVPVSQYEAWVKEALHPDSYKEVKAAYGEAPGTYMTIEREGTRYLVIPRVKFGNIVLMPVLSASIGTKEFKMQHGVKQAPPHAYIASYLWPRFSHKTHILTHFGAHGSVEFTPWKQIALSLKDWPEALTGPTPHVYIYSIDNIGEAMMAKRRTYATMLSHLTPPQDFAEPPGPVSRLEQMLHDIERPINENMRREIATLVDSMGIAGDLEWPDTSMKNLNEEKVKELHNYVHHLKNEKINIGLHILGKSYSTEEIKNTVRMMGVDPILYTLAELEIAEGREEQKILEEPHSLEKYRSLAEEIIATAYVNDFYPVEKMLSGYPRLQPILKKWEQDSSRHKTALSDKEKSHLRLWESLKEAIANIPVNKSNLGHSPRRELEGYANAVTGGYLEASSGGDPVRNPSAIPTGRNLYSINAENTPDAAAWKTGKELGEAVLKAHLEKHGKYPKKIAYTLWGGEFIRNQGLNIAQIFYMLGVEPVSNHRGRVHDVKLIPMERLQRPRIDVVVQTSGQFRDIAHSRISLINKAVALAAQADDEGEFSNYVAQGVKASEQEMKKAGIAPDKAKAFSSVRVFGGLNGKYGTAIMELVEKGDRWENEKEVAARYLNNMGALYAEGFWAHYEKGIFEAALQNTEVVMHPRSSNVTGPISLDHVYEFMGGLTLAVRNVTGKDPDGYFNDFRSRPRIQSLKQAIWTETRTNLFNPKYIKAQMAEGPTAAENFAESFRDTYGWNVMKPAAIDKEVWDGYYDIYVKDKLNLKLPEFFEKTNPYALQEMTAVMLETVRKGYWKPDARVVQDLVDRHSELVITHGAGCSGFVCDNAKLKAMISKMADPKIREAYNQNIAKIRQGSGTETQKGMKLKKETLHESGQTQIKNPSLKIAAILLGLILLGGLIWGFRGKKSWS